MTCVYYLITFLRISWSCPFQELVQNENKGIFSDFDSHLNICIFINSQVLGVHKVHLNYFLYSVIVK